MASQFYWPPTQNGLQKELDAQLDTGTTASMTLNNVTGVQNKPGVVVINRITSGGVEKDSADREWVSYTGTSGNTLTGLTRGLGGSTDQDHAIGSVVEFVPDITVWQAVIDALTGTSTTAIEDTNANELLKTSTTTSAVNELTIKNAATGNGPQIQATGDDTNVTLNLVPKGAGVVDAQVGLKIATSTVTADNILDEDNMASDSATALSTQQSIKAYVDTQIAGVGVSTQTRSIWLPASSMGATLGTPTLTDTDDTGAYWALDATADEGVGTVFLIPADFSSGNITFYVYWASLTTNTGNIRWNIRRSIPAAEDELVLTANTNTSFTEAAIATTNDLNISAGQEVSGAAAGDAMAFSVRRLGSDGADTLAGDVAFLGVRIDYTSAQ